MAVKKRVKIKKIHHDPKDKVIITKNLLLASSLLLIVVFAIFANSLPNDFSKLDDYDYIVNYGHFDRPLNFDGLKQIFVEIPRTELHDYYRPLYILIRSIDYNIWKINPFGYHLTNLLFFFLCCLLVYLIVSHLLKSHWMAMVTSLLFATHPIHTESVSWVMAGGYPMSCFFIFLAFYCYLQVTSNTEFYKWLVICLFSYLSAVLINPPAIILPAFIFFYDIFRKQKIFSKKILTCYAGLGIIAYTIIFINYKIFPTDYIGSYADDFSAFMTLIYNLTLYFFTMLFPFWLHTPREYTVYSVLNPKFILSLLFLIVLFIYFIREFRKRSWVGFGIGWFCIGLIPSLTLWKNPSSFAERYALYSSFGFSLITAIFIQNFTRYFLRFNLDRKAISIIQKVIIALLLVFYSIITVGRNNVWRNSETLFLDTLKKSPGNAHTSNTLGAYYITIKNTPEKAIPILRYAVEFHENRFSQMPTYELQNAEQIYLTNLRNRLGSAYRSTGQINLAIKEHEKAMEYKPQRNDAYFNLAMDYEFLAEAEVKNNNPELVKSNYEKALDYYKQSISKNLKHSVSYFNAGLVLFSLNRIDECIDFIKDGLILSPFNFKAHGLLAHAYIQNKQYKEAESLLRKTITMAEERRAKIVVNDLKRQLIRVNKRLGIDSKEIKISLDITNPKDKFIFLFKNRRYEEALNIALEMEKESTDDPILQSNIGLCYYKLGKNEEAEIYYNQAILLDPNYEVPYYNLSLIYAKTGQLDKAIQMCEIALSINPDYRHAHLKLKLFKQAKDLISGK